jgi:hypothetical protein
MKTLFNTIMQKLPGLLLLFHFKQGSNKKTGPPKADRQFRTVASYVRNFLNGRRSILILIYEPGLQILPAVAA